MEIIRFPFDSNCLKVPQQQQVLGCGARAAGIMRFKLEVPGIPKNNGGPMYPETVFPHSLKNYCTFKGPRTQIIGF